MPGAPVYTTDISQGIVSASLLTSFDKCERRGYWEYVRGLVPGTPSSPLSFGKLIHECTDMWRRSEKDDAKVLAHFNAQAPTLPVDPRGQRTREIGVKMLKGYFSKYKSEPFKVLATEVPFVIPLPGDIKVVGFIDGVVDWTGQIYGLETKTTSSLGAEFMKQFNPNLQIDIEAYAVWKTFGRCEGMVIDAMSTAKTRAGTPDGYLRDISGRTPEDYVHLEKVLARKVERLQNVVAEYQGNLKLDPNREPEYREDLFDQRYTSCYYYGACPYVKLCMHRDDVFTEELVAKEKRGVPDGRLQEVARAVGGAVGGDGSDAEPAGESFIEVHEGSGGSGDQSQDPGSDGEAGQGSASGRGGVA